MTSSGFVGYRGGLLDRESRVLSALDRSFGSILSRVQGSGESPRVDGIAVEAESVADKVARIIADFSRPVADPAVREKNIEGIRTRIVAFVRRGVPVEAQMLWSPKKHWMGGAESNVDLAELAALQTLLSIDSAVRDAYPAGIAFRLEVEDIEFEFMERQNQEIIDARETYIAGLACLIRTLRLSESFTVRRVSGHAASAEELMRWRQQMAQNHRALEAYWHESEGRTSSEQEALSSFRELCQLGWKGTIPPEMRRYYLNRLGTLADASDRTRVDMVLRNLAGILLHHQIGLVRGFGIDPVRFSFVRPAAAAPAELLHGRVDLRFAPRKLCSRVSAAAPWSTKGFIGGRGDQVLVSFRGRHELAGVQCRFVEGWLTVAGREGLAEIRADFLCDAD